MSFFIGCTQQDNEFTATLQVCRFAPQFQLQKKQHSRYHQHSKQRDCFPAHSDLMRSSALISNQYRLGRLMGSVDALEFISPKKE
mmetsp:Transcript_8116/g.16517  ORF Transcript_8116/g.16517 Transcript_8116/m.16517 type:complete len:85 (-) Transcript_8116:498-752(-)